MVTINGEPLDLAGTVLLDWLRARGCDPRRIAVECNGKIVPRETLATRILEEGDEVEIVRFVGGG